MENRGNSFFKMTWTRNQQQSRKKVGKFWAWAQEFLTGPNPFRADHDIWPGGWGGQLSNEGGRPSSVAQTRIIGASDSQRNKINIDLSPTSIFSLPQHDERKKSSDPAKTTNEMHHRLVNLSLNAQAS
jgi:hypothetical protein